MAIRDYTSRIRPSVPADDTLPGPPDALPPARVAWPEASPRRTRADIALAVLTLTRLHYDSERWRKAQARGFPARSLVWPLSGAETASLDTAVQCLQQYARLLGHVPRVSYPPGH
jgi:hypothetical protein